MSGNVFMTGSAELDRALADLEPKVQRKYGRKALNEAIKIVAEDYKERVPVDTGAMRDAIERYTPKGSRGQLRRALRITRASLAREMAKYQDEDIDKVEFRGFYPAFVELGTSERGARRPLRNALYGNELQIRFIVNLELTKLITDAKARK